MTWKNLYHKLRLFRRTNHTSLEEVALVQAKVEGNGQNARISWLHHDCCTTLVWLHLCAIQIGFGVVQYTLINQVI